MTGRAALALAVANVAVGLLNYLFQVHGAAVLEAASFGLLSAWLAQVTVVGAVATVVQFASLDAPLDDARFERLLRAVGLASLVVLAAHVALGYGASRVLLGASTVLGTILLYAVVGQLQARLRLGDVAGAVLAAAALRFLLPFAWPREARAPAFFVAHAGAAFAGIVAAYLLVALRPAAAVPRSARPSAAGVLSRPEERRLRLGRPVLLAFATVLFPVVDILVIAATHDGATTGAFSRVALAARIVFFGGAAILQILLPHQLHAARTGEALPRFVVHIERWFAPCLLGGAVAFAALLDRVVLRAQGEERTWLFATCVGSALLVAVLDHVQRFAALERLSVAVGCVAGVAVTSTVAAALGTLGGSASVTRYAVAAAVGYAVVLLVAQVKQRNSRIRRPEVSSPP